LKYALLLLTYFYLISLNSQTVLKSDGPGNTYELINSVLAPSYDVIETPDCAHNKFGRHITEEWDEELNSFVFVFHSHINEDNDRCNKFDRQRTEIKTYKQSTDSLLGTQGETVTYKWKFKLDKDFQPSNSFTHIHQIKAVGGSEDAMPSVTFTLRKSKVDKFQVRFASNMVQSDLISLPLDEFKGIWVQVYEQITYGDKGKYELKITKVDNNKTIVSYSNDSLRMWKTNAEFLRPKWGIYRSLKNALNLKDEKIKFADFYIKEITKKQ